MATFIGTAEDFDKFVMPRVRNVIQTATRPLKQRAGGRCEHCGRECSTLEAAHVHGRDRKTLVRKAMAPYLEGDQYVIGSLERLEDEIMEEHQPLGECFLFLCRECHKRYDSVADHGAHAERAAEETRTQGNEGNRPNNQLCETDSTSPNTIRPLCRRSTGETLPIALIPSDSKAFRDEFLRTGRAEIREYFTDGHVETIPWERRSSGGFSKSSNVIGNLRSRRRYRQGEWQNNGLSRLAVEVIR